MKKTALTLALAAAAAALAPSAQAQTATGTVNVSARINAILTATVVENLNFGTAIAPNAGTVSVATGTAPSGVGQTLGAIQISHNSDFSTAVTSASTNLTNGTDNLPVAFNCAYSTSASGAVATGSAALCSAMPNRASATLGTTQTTYLQVGGNLTVPAGVQPGTYTGSISFLLTAITS